MAKPHSTIRLCSVEGCDRKRQTKEYCLLHYKRWKRNGHTDLVNPTAHMTDDERFEYYLLDIPFSECQLWGGNTNSDGYGRIRINKRMESAHRYQWIRHYGEIPKGLCVLHTCHNGHLGCCSIEHLKLGTHQKNMTDRMLYGKQIRGTRVSSSKLNERKVKDIRLLSLTGQTYRDISKLYGVNETAISAVVKGTSWKHVR